MTYAPEGGYTAIRTAPRPSLTASRLAWRAATAGNLQQQTEQLLQGFAQNNPNLRRQGGYSRTSIGGRQGITTTLSNVSDVTGETEAVNVSTVQLRDGSLLFLIGVAPADESRTYLATFGRVRQSVQLADRLVASR